MFLSFYNFLLINLHMDFIVPHFMVYVIIYWDFDMSENNVWIPFYSSSRKTRDFSHGISAKRKTRTRGAGLASES